MFVETLLRRVVNLAEEYPRREVPGRVLWEEPGDDYEEYIEAAKRLEGEGLVERGEPKKYQPNGGFGYQPFGWFRYHSIDCL